MRNFLKQNLIAILVCVTFVAAIGSATTITRPYSSADYAGGTKAVGSKVNAEFASIVAWLNGANIDSTNIATSGVATSNIASFAVTTAKINTGAVTPVKLAALNLKVTGTSSLYNLTGTVVPATITNLSTTFTSNGRPARISLQPNTSTYLSSNVATWGSMVLPVMNNAGSAHIFFVRDGSTTAHFVLDSDLADAELNHQGCGSFWYIEPTLDAEVTYTFEAKASVTPSTNSLYVINCRLMVEEL